MSQNTDIRTLGSCSSTDNDLQGSDGSGSLGGPDVRRRIPIKLLSKQAIRSKPPPRIQRPGSRPPKSETGEDGRLIVKLALLLGMFITLMFRPKQAGIFISNSFIWGVT